MKKSLLFVLAAIVLVACSNEDLIDNETSQVPAKRVSNLRSYEEALEIAQSSISLVDGSSQTRSSSSRRIDLSNSKICRAGAQTRSANSGADTLMYVFNFEDNAGFAIVSASRNTEELLAVTEKGHYDPDTPSENEGFNLFMEMAEKYVKESRPRVGGGGGEVIIPQIIHSPVYEHDSIGPYLTVNWGEYHPEGEFCSNGVAGETNVAIAQLMTHYCYPSSILLTYPGADLYSQTLDWSTMKAHPSTDQHVLADCVVPTIHQSIGRLVREIGERTNTQYYFPPGSGYPPFTLSVESPYVQNMLSNLGYQTSSSWADFDYDVIMTHLNANHLLLAHSDSHSWVIDGYDYTESGYVDLAPWGLNGELIVIHEYITYTRLCHYNWGRYGDCNGYFAAGVFNSQQGTSYDGTHNANFSSLPDYVQILPAYHIQ